MKLIKQKLRMVVIAVSLLLASLIVYGTWSLGVSGNRWFSSSVNTSLRKVREDVTPGNIYDRNNIQLAGSNLQGKRLYHQDALTRRAMVIASAAAVASSSKEALASSRPVRSISHWAVSRPKLAYLKKPSSEKLTTTPMVSTRRRSPGCCGSASDARSHDHDREAR